MSSRARLWLLTLLLFGGFVLRAHQPGALAGFVDEVSHIERSEIIFTAERNPTEYSHGKLLYYYWLGLFGTARTNALEMMRLATALLSLLTIAAVAATARALFGPRAMLAAALVYALAPFAVFFERMALADPLATALASLAAWHSILLARAPSQRRGLLTGLLVNGAVFAKLTVAPVLALPVLAAILFGDVPSPDLRRASLTIYARALWRRYRLAWRPITLVFAIGWALFGVGALIALLQGGRPLLMNTYLAEPSARPDDLFDKLSGLAGRIDLFLSPGLALGALLLGAVAIGYRTRATLYTLAWLALLWGPSVLLATSLQSRYLLAGIPPIAVLVGGGIVALLRLRALRRRPPARTAVRAMTALALAAWAISFALPFDWRASTDPAALELPRRDSYDYFWGSFNGWGTREALRYVTERGDRVGDQVPAIGVMQLCSLATLYATPEIDWRCHDYYRLGEDVTFNPARWRFLPEALDDLPWVYLVTEFPEAVPLDSPPALDGLRWERVFGFAKPHGERVIAVWRVTRDE